MDTREVDGETAIQELRGMASERLRMILAGDDVERLDRITDAAAPVELMEVLPTVSLRLAPSEWLEVTLTADGEVYAAMFTTSALGGSRDTGPVTVYLSTDEAEHLGELYGVRGFAKFFQGGE